MKKRFFMVFILTLVLLSFGAGFFAFIAFSVAFRRSLQARAESQQLLAELMSAQGRLRDMAVMEERQRLAREMHDAVGHRLTAAAQPSSRNTFWATL